MLESARANSSKYVVVFGTAQIINRDEETCSDKLSWVLEKHISNEDASRYLNDFILPELDFISVSPDEITTYEDED
jgi:nitroimidazol reductase NimA-like FMN-containing flavoprotein (pyridoxamine 5'-phosphate oxidase superfamily)